MKTKKCSELATRYSQRSSIAQQHYSSTDSSVDSPITHDTRHRTYVNYYINSASAATVEL